MRYFQCQGNPMPLVRPSLVRPFAALRPAPGRAPEVIAPPYDVLNTEEARILAEGRPWSFLHISKPEIDLPAGTDPYAPQVYAKAAENLKKMRDAGVLLRDEVACYYAYRLIMNDHVQVGLVAATSVADYDSNRIRKHEFTRPDKEDDRVRQIDALNAQTGPVFLTYKHNAAIDELAAKVTAAAPEIDIVADTGVRHSLWVVSDAAQLDLITGTFDAMDCLYIADGHHRSAAASRVHAARGGQPSEHGVFLAVVFPHDQMQILAYNRLVRDPHRRTPEALLAALRGVWDLEPAPAPAPEAPLAFGVYLGKRWWRARVRPGSYDAADPVAALDCSIAQD